MRYKPNICQLITQRHKTQELLKLLRILDNNSAFNIELIILFYYSTIALKHPKQNKTDTGKNNSRNRCIVVVIP